MKEQMLVAKATLTLVAFAGVVGLVGCWNVIDKAAQEEFESRPRPISITVYPVHVIKGMGQVEHDADLGRRLARFLREEGLAEAVAADALVEVPFESGMNQAKMLQRSGNRFSTHIAQTSIETHYGRYTVVGKTSPFGTPSTSAWVLVLDQNGEIQRAITHGGVTTTTPPGAPFPKCRIACVWGVYDLSGSVLHRRGSLYPLGGAGGAFLRRAGAGRDTGRLTRPGRPRPQPNDCANLRPSAPVAQSG